MNKTQITMSWKELRKRDHFSTSASQHETFDLCKRKWWLKQVRRLLDPSSKSKVFGTVTHAVCERYLLADDLGRDRSTGKAVELYPPNWHVAYDRYTGEVEGELTLSEQDLVRKLVASAIESGVLERQPGRKVEQEFKQVLLEQEGVTVLIKGFIDLSYPNRIEDHKTTKSMRWAKTPKKLLDNLQALLYAKMKIEERKKEGGSVPSAMTLRHNIYCKDTEKPKVRRVEVDAPIERIEKNWEHVKENAQEMIRLRKSADEWHEIPEPCNPSKACNAYGGCCYRSICSGKESELGYEQRVSRYMEYKQKESASKAEVNNCQPYLQKGNEMDFQAKLAQKKAMQAQAAGATGTAPPASINPPVPETPAPAATQPVTPAAPPAPVASPAPAQTPAASIGLVPPPWAEASCKACRGSGFNVKGVTCRICDGKTQAAGRPNSMSYHLQALGDGTVAWVGKEDTPAAGQEGVSPLPASAQTTAPVQSDERVQTPAPTPTPSPTPTQAPAPLQEPAPDALQALQTQTGQGRPKKGFILCVNCTPIKGQERRNSGRHVIFLVDILQEMQQEMAKVAGKSSFFDINAFDRRDALAKAADKITEDFGADIVVVTGVGTGQSDMRALVDALLPLAGMVIMSEAA